MQRGKVLALVEFLTEVRCLVPLRAYDGICYEPTRIRLIVSRASMSGIDEPRLDFTFTCNYAEFDGGPPIVHHYDRPTLH